MSFAPSMKRDIALSSMSTCFVVVSFTRRRRSSKPPSAFAGTSPTIRATRSPAWRTPWLRMSCVISPTSSAEPMPTAINACADIVRATVDLSTDLD